MGSFYGWCVPRNADLRTPASFVRAGTWPHEPLLEPGLAEYARQIALNLLEAMGSRSIREVASAAGLTHSTLARVLSGERWPDTLTLAKLERALSTQLWPRTDPGFRAAVGK